MLLLIFPGSAFSAVILFSHCREGVSVCSAGNCARHGAGNICRGP